MYFDSSWRINFLVQNWDKCKTATLSQKQGAVTGAKTATSLYILKNQRSHYSHSNRQNTFTREDVRKLQYKVLFFKVFQKCWETANKQTREKWNRMATIICPSICWGENRVRHCSSFRSGSLHMIKNFLLLLKSSQPAFWRPFPPLLSYHIPYHYCLYFFFFLSL